MRKTLLIAATLLVAGVAHAQQYPNRPVKVIIPWPPGQATDLAARIIGQKLQEAFGQPFIMENKPGAGGAIGTQEVVRSAPDGYTLLASSSGPLSIKPNLEKVSYDATKDLAGVSLTALAPFALVSGPAFQANSAKDLVALVKANPGKYTFASSGTGATAHLFSEMLVAATDMKARHVPYKGSAPALTDVMNGSVDFTIETVASIVGHVKNGRLKVFGVTTAKRSSALPEVPTLTEALGLKGYDNAAWIGYAAPAGTPKEILERLAAEIKKAAAMPDIKERYLTLGMETAANTPAEMDAMMKSELARYGQAIKAAGIKVEQ